MNRRQRNWTFWILVFSLNLVPVLASGEDGKSAAMTTSDVKAAQAEAKKAEAEAKKAEAEAKKDKAKADAEERKEKANAAAVAKAEAQKAKADERKAKAEKAKADILKASKPKTSVSRNDLQPVVALSPPHDVTLAEMGSLFMAFDARLDGAERAILIGRVFNNCKDRFEVSTMTKGCGNNPAFKVVDKGAIECMKAHKESNDICTDETCTYVSKIPGASMDLSVTGDGNVQLLHGNPNGNEDSKFICEDFPRGLNHTSAATLAATAAKARADARAARLQAAEANFRNCRHNSEELAIARQAETFRAAVNHLSDAEQSRDIKALDDAEFRILSSRAAHDSLDDLDAVRSDITSWASEHPSQCSKAVEPLREIARRQATHKVRRTRDSAENPMQGYDDALATFDTSTDEAECLGDNSRLAEMRMNLEVNRLDQFGTQNGTNSLEFRTQYMGLAQEMQQNWYEACASGMDQMSCSTAQGSMQSLSTIYNDATQADQRRYQSMMAMQQMRAQMGMQGGMAGGMQGMSGGYAGTSGSGNFGFGHL